MAIAQIAPHAHGMQLVATAERVDVIAEAEEKTCVAKRDPDWVDKYHNDAEFMCIEEARRLAVDR